MVYADCSYKASLNICMGNLFNKTKFSPFLWTIWLVICILIMFNPMRSLAADIDQATARKLRSSRQILPLEKIHTKAKAIKAGKILETELESKKGQYIYEIELLDDKGIVWEIKLNARTGQLIKLEED
jgi:uncharacterized membrane protein